MSDFAQAALISGGIFAIIMMRGYGRRVWDRGAVLFPLLMVAGFGYGYLHDAPTTHTDLLAYAVALALGVVFGGLASVSTRVERDAASGSAMTVTGPAFAAIWASAVALRLGFIYAVEHWHWARMQFGEFMITHHVDFTAIAPFFILWVLGMVLTRLVAVGLRTATLPAGRAAYALA